MNSVITIVWNKCRSIGISGVARTIKPRMSSAILMVTLAVMAWFYPSHGWDWMFFDESVPSRPATTAPPHTSKPENAPSPASTPSPEPTTGATETAPEESLSPSANVPSSSAQSDVTREQTQPSTTSYRAPQPQRTQQPTPEESQYQPPASTQSPPSSATDDGYSPPEEPQNGSQRDFPDVFGLFPQ